MKEIKVNYLGHYTFIVQYFDVDDIHAVYLDSDIQQLDNLVDLLIDDVMDKINNEVIENERPTLW